MNNYFFQSKIFDSKEGVGEIISGGGESKGKGVGGIHAWAGSNEGKKTWQISWIILPSYILDTYIDR